MSSDDGNCQVSACSSGDLRELHEKLLALVDLDDGVAGAVAPPPQVFFSFWLLLLFLFLLLLLHDFGVSAALPSLVSLSFTSKRSHCVVILNCSPLGVPVILLLFEIWIFSCLIFIEISFGLVLLWTISCISHDFLLDSLSFLVLSVSWCSLEKGNFLVLFFFRWMSRFYAIVSEVSVLFHFYSVVFRHINRWIVLISLILVQLFESMPSRIFRKSFIGRRNFHQ